MKKVNSLFAVFVIVNCAIYFQIEAAFATSSYHLQFNRNRRWDLILPLSEIWVVVL